MTPSTMRPKGYLGAGKWSKKWEIVRFINNKKVGDGRYGSKTGEGARKFEKYAGATICEEGEFLLATHLKYTSRISYKLDLGIQDW